VDSLVGEAEEMVVYVVLLVEEVVEDTTMKMEMTTKSEIGVMMIPTKVVVVRFHHVCSAGVMSARVAEREMI
jgi:hypothetical protein